ncbi:fibronectin type III domain-containing protein [Marinobacter bryozoorum]|uniref:fibronectin type III domain-containing protein n=1 Tax=Marinobacter bryozoorum TaxID=256324 RepID=UPI002005C24E|nr:fibronectin type III domain-containing protein [Marinobacter bryozoorum]MCK7544850.1 fibronectin type III domain-containing protein [Marinobacter bryozoorum]
MLLSSGQCSVLTGLLLAAAMLSGCGGGGSGSSGGDKSVTLSWDAPGSRENGEQLANHELGGFVVRYGASRQAMSRRLNVGACISCEVTVSGLDQGTWYFYVQTVDSNGLLSVPSQVVSASL